MATFYFLNTDNDADWNNSNNWYYDSGGTNPTYSTPSQYDDAVILALCDGYTGSYPVIINNLTLSNNINWNITVTGLCTITNYGYFGDGGTLTGNILVTTDGFIGLGGTAYVYGDVTFANNGTIDSNLICYGNIFIDSSFTGNNIPNSSFTCNNLVYTYGYGGSVGYGNINQRTLYKDYPVLYYTNYNSNDWGDNLNWFVDSYHSMFSYSIPNGNSICYLTNTASTNSYPPASAYILYSDNGVMDIDMYLGSGFFFNSLMGTNSVSSINASGIAMSGLSINGTYGSMQGTIDKIKLYDNSYNLGYMADVEIEYPYDRNILSSGGTVGSVSYYNYPTYFYYTTGVGYSLNSLGNWFIDNSFSTASAYIPGALDDVILTGPAFQTSTGIFNNNIIFNMNPMYPQFNCSVPISGNAIYVSGNSTIMEYNWTPTTLISNSGCFFVENSALNSGIVNSNDGCVFKDSSYNGGIINATGVSYLNNSTSNGTNLCAASFYDNSSYTGGYSLGSSFYDTSSHVGGYTPTGYFYNSGIISGGTLDTAEVIYPHQLPFTTGTASIGNLFFTNFPTRTVYFYSVGSTDFPDLNNWWDDNNHTVQASYLPGGSPSNRSSLQNNVADSIVILSNLQNNMAGCFTSLDTVTVSGNASLDLNIGSNALYFFDFSNHGAVSQTTNETYFFDHSTNTGTINTNYLYVNYPVSIPLGGTINVTWTATYYGYTTYFNDTITSDGDWNNANNWFLDEANTIASNAVPTETFPGSSVILQTNVSYSSGGTPTAFDLLCPNQTGCPLDNPNPGISLGIPVTVYGLATFNTTTFCINSSTGGILTGTVNGDALFKDFGTNQGGTVTGTATFSLQAAANMIQNGYDGVYTIIEFDYQKGINGSSILGLV